MRVLMVSADRGLFGGGSSGDVLERHGQYADKAGKLDIIVFADKSYEPKQIGENLRIFPTKSAKFAHYKKATDLGIALSKENNYDLLITQDIAAPIGDKIKRVTKIPWIVTIHSMFFSSQWLKKNPINWYLLFRIKRAIYKADAFRVTNRAIEDKLKEWQINKPVLVLPTPVNVKKFLQIEKHKHDGLNFLYVGRLAKEKNLSLLISTFRNLDEKNINLYIVGEGAEAESLEKLASGDERVKLVGPKTHDELLNIYETTDIFVLPSDTESFGKVLIEAGAAGCVLVASRTFGAGSIIENEKTGILFEVGSQNDLNLVFEKLLHDRNLREKLGQNAKEMAKKYDGEKTTQTWLSFWKQVATRYKVGL